MSKVGEESAPAVASWSVGTDEQVDLGAKAYPAQTAQTTDMEAAPTEDTSDPHQGCWPQVHQTYHQAHHRVSTTWQRCGQTARQIMA